MATFLAYALGHGLVLMALTVALALAKQSLVRSLRGAMRYIDRVAGVLLIVAGGYLIYYWTFNIATDYSSATGVGADHVRGGPLGPHRDEHPGLGRRTRSGSCSLSPSPGPRGTVLFALAVDSAGRR